MGFSGDEIVDVVDLLLQPRMYIRNIRDEIRIDEGVARRSVVFDFVAPANGPAKPRVIYFPLLAPAAGSSPTSLRALGRSGQLLSILNGREQVELIDRIRSAVDAGGRPETRQQLAVFLKDQYLLFAAVHVEPGTHNLVRLESDVDFFSRGNDLGSRLRRVLGYKPYVLRFETPHVQIGETYDLEVVGPSDHFIRYQAFVAEYERVVVDQLQSVSGARVADPDPPPAPAEAHRLLVPLDSELGGTNVGPRTRASGIAALHVSASASPEFRRDAQALVVFNERPPGILGSSLLFGSLVLVALIAAAASFRAIVGEPGISSEAAVIILTVPGTVALWLRPKGGHGTAVDPPLMARFSTLLVGFISYLTGLTLFLSDVASERFAQHGRVVPNHGPYRYPNDIPLAIGSWHVRLYWLYLRGSYVAWAGAIVVALALVFLSIRLLFSFRDLAHARTLEAPRPLPDKLVRAARQPRRQ